jgi:hypothetical protein
MKKQHDERNGNFLARVLLVEKRTKWSLFVAAGTILSGPVRM